MGSIYDRAQTDCWQDDCENVPFGSVGGRASRHALQRPDYISEADGPEYLRGYEDKARALYGDDWRTCAFGWAPALVIESEAS